MEPEFRTNEFEFANKYKGQKALILGKGPSLLDIDRRFISSYIVIGTNDVFRFTRCDYVFFMDSITYAEKRQEFDYVSLREGTQLWSFWHNEGATKFLLQEKQPYGLEPNKYFHGYTSAFVALQMAIWMGCSEIILAGVDLRLPSQGDYYDGSNAREGVGFLRHLDSMRQGFILAAEFQKVFGYQVFRISDKSSLDCFPVKPLSVS